MGVDRREFIKFAGLAATLGLTGRTAVGALASVIWASLLATS